MNASRLRASPKHQAAILAELAELLAPGQQDAFLERLAQERSAIDIDAPLKAWPQDQGESLACLASGRGLERPLQALLDGGANPNRAFGQVSPLARAAGQPACLALLLAADPNGHPSQRHAPLLRALLAGCPASCVMLLEAGADPSPPSAPRGVALAADERALRRPECLDAANAIESWREAQSLRESLPLAPKAMPKTL